MAPVAARLIGATMLERLLAPLRGARTPRRRLGDAGERTAVAFLRGLGYRIVATNVEVRLDRSAGRAITAEVDVVAYDGPTLVFVEVKSRRREGELPAERAVDARKRRLLVRAAARYRRLMGVADEPYRFDVVAVLMPEGERPHVRLRRGYFTDRRSRGDREEGSE